MSQKLWMAGIAIGLILGSRALAADREGAAAGPLDLPIRAKMTAADAQPTQIRARAVKAAGQPWRVEVQTKDAAGGRAPAAIRADEGPGGAVQLLAAPNEVQPNEVRPNKVFELLGRPVKLGEYWLGVGCRPARGPLNAQLGLPEDQGLVVENVVPGSPAEKAGLEQYDVLVQAGQRRLADVAALIEAVDEAKGSELPIELYRGGEKQTVRVTPEKRPQDRLGPGVGVPLQEDWQRVERWLTRLRPGQIVKGPTNLRILRPGMILPPGAKVPNALRGKVQISVDDGQMQISIRKEGDKPAKISVSKGDRKWELTEDDLDSLPEEVRGRVVGLLDRIAVGRVAPIRAWDVIPKGPSEESQAPRPPSEPEISRAEQGRLERLMERRLQEMNRRIDNLRELLEELRERRPRQGPPAADPDAE